MEVQEYYSCEEAQRAHWQEEIGKCGWPAGEYLRDLLKKDALRALAGADARVYLLTDGEKLVSFCTLAARDDIPDTALAPWIGFVYTFPAYRGARNFGALLAAAVEQARADGAEAVYISTDTTGLYEKYGAAFYRMLPDRAGGVSRVYRLDFGWQVADGAERAQGFPARDKAERILAASALFNPGRWDDHSRHVALAAARIARAVGAMDPEKAYVLGLLHDIGRRFGKGHLQHVWYGWQYMETLGYSAAGRICLTHSFKVGELAEYIGRHDLREDRRRAVEEALAACVFDDYDRLIQLCDTLAGAEGVTTIEERMADVARRYGQPYPRDKWEASVALFEEFASRAGGDLYAIARGEA